MNKICLPLLFVLLTATFAAAQDVPVAAMTDKPAAQNDLTKTFETFSFEIPNDSWRVTSKAGSVEAIYGDRLDGYLQIRKAEVGDGETLGDVLIREQDQKLQFLPGFANGKEESFKGNLSGKAVNYEFTQSGKPMTGRVYFLQNGTDVWILRFTGSSQKLKLLRNQTDSIARTFKLKK